MIVHKELKPTTILGKVYLPGIFLLDYSFSDVDGISEWSFLTFDELELNTLYYVYNLFNFDYQLDWPEWVKLEEYKLMITTDRVYWYHRSKHIDVTENESYLYNVHPPSILKQRLVERNDLKKRYNKCNTRKN